MISAEAPVLFAKAAEIFINELTLRAWVHAEENKRRTLQVSYLIIDSDCLSVDFFAEKFCGNACCRSVFLSAINEDDDDVFIKISFSIFNRELIPIYEEL